MTPALARGTIFGPFDNLSVVGLTAHPGGVQHFPGTSDLMQLMVPWTQLAWTQVHHGQLPLWNPYNALGTPLVFNWQSGAFSLPSLLGYIAPLAQAYTVAVLVKVVLAGTGVYVLCRLLDLGVVGSAMAATVFELSGSMMGWIGYPTTSVFAMTGWLLAGVVLIAKGQQRVRSVALLAVVIAITIYGGFPEGLVILVLAVGTFAVVFFVASRLVGGSWRWSTVVDVALASLAGAALGASPAPPRSTAGVRLGSQCGVERSAGAREHHPLSVPGLQRTASRRPRRISERLR